MMEVTPKLGDFVVSVDISRTQRCQLLIPVRAANATEANSLGRSMAREAMDGRRRLDASDSRYLPWMLDSSTTTRTETQ